MARRRTFIALLDKKYPPEEAFIDGMLTDVYPRATGDFVVLLTERNENEPAVVRRGKAVCINVLPQRTGVYRFIGGVYAYFVTRALRKKFQKRQRPIVLMARNEPTYLLAAAGAKASGVGLVYQSTFPHEAPETPSLKSRIGTVMITLGLRAADGILGVTKLGTERVQALKPSRIFRVGVVPMAIDAQVTALADSTQGPGDTLKVLYLGTHIADRRLDLVLEACARAIKQGAVLDIKFVGGEQEDIQRLRKESHVVELEQLGVLEFIPKIPREEALSYLQWADVGISLIPPTRVYQESSPTKLSEYLGAGVFAIANYGIPAQEELIEVAGGGTLVHFSVDQMAAALTQIWETRADLRAQQSRTRAYMRAHYTYNAFLPDFLHATWDHRE